MNLLKKFEGPKGFYAGGGIGLAADILTHHKIANYGAAGMITGSVLGMYAADKRRELSIRTLAEVSGRPLLATKVAQKIAYDEKNYKLADALLDWGNNGPRMNKTQRGFFERAFGESFGIPSEERQWAKDQKIFRASQKGWIKKKK